MWSEFVCGISLIINKIIRDFTERLTKITFAPIFMANAKGNPTKMVVSNLGYHPIDIFYVWSGDFITKCVIGWFDWKWNALRKLMIEKAIITSFPLTQLHWRTFINIYTIFFIMTKVKYLNFLYSCSFSHSTQA